MFRHTLYDLRVPDVHQLTLIFSSQIQSGTIFIEAYFVKMVSVSLAVLGAL